MKNYAFRILKKLTILSYIKKNLRRTENFILIIKTIDRLTHFMEITVLENI